MKGQWSKLFVFTVAFLLFAGACAAPPPPPTPTPIPPTPTPDPAAAVQAWVDALNSGDVNATLALFKDDLKFDVFEYHARNKDELRGILDWLAGLETKYQIKECQTKEDRVVCTMPVSDACIAGYDPVAGLMSKMTFVPTQDGKISQVSGYPDGFGDYYAKWITPGTTWMRANRAEELAKAESSSDGREAGAIQAKLCKEYGENLKATPAAPASTPLDIVQKYQDAVGRHDVEAAMALFTDDATYTWGDYFTTSDMTLIRNWLEYAAALNMQTTVNDCKLTDPTVTCDWRYVEECGRIGATGNFGVDATVVFTVKEGKISRIVVAPNPDPEYYKWTQAFLKWYEDTTPTEARSFTQALDTLKFGREFGERLSELCKEHAESLKATTAATSDLTAPVQAWVDALNSGDVDAALTLFADDGKYQLHYDARGKEQIRSVFDWLAGLETKSQLADCQPKSDRVVCNYIVRDACMAAFGTDGLPVKATFVVQDGKVKQAIGYGTGSEWDSYWKFVDAETTWAAVNRAEEWAKFRPLSKEFAPVAVKLCKEYAESLKATPAPKQVLLVIGLEQSVDMELMLTKEVAVMVSMLEKAGYEVVVASASGEPITGGATTLKPDLKLADAKVDDYMGFMFPCLAVDLDLPPPAEAVRIAKEAVAQGKPVAAQIGGVVTLAVAEVLNGKQFAFPEDPGAYMPGGIYKGTGVVQDGNIITSGTCPMMARMMGRTDGTPELTQKFIDLLAASQK